MTRPIVVGGSARRTVGVLVVAALVSALGAWLLWLTIGPLPRIGRENYRDGDRIEIDCTRFVAPSRCIGSDGTTVDVRVTDEPHGIVRAHVDRARPPYVVIDGARTADVARAIALSLALPVAIGAVMLGRRRRARINARH